MPSRSEIQAIAKSFGSQYGVDLAAIEKDSEKIRRLVEKEGVNHINAFEIYSESITCNPALDCAIIPDLESFEFADIPPDPNLIDSRVEQNIEEAIKYADNCLQIRRQYGELAKSRNDTRFKFEEFVRIDLIHQEEVKAGLYELPLKQARADLESINASIAGANSQITAIDEMYAAKGEENYSNALAPDKVAGYVADVAFVARATANDKDKVEDASTRSTEYRIRLEHGSWAQTKLAAIGQRAEHQAKLGAADEKVLYLVKDVAFRTHRASVSRQLAWLQINEHARPNSAINYDKRMLGLKDIFDANLRLLIQRVNALDSGLSKHYGIDAVLQKGKKGEILDGVAIYLIAVQDLLAKYKRKQRTAIASKSTVGHLEHYPHKNGGKRFETEITIDDSMLPDGYNLLKGVAFEYFGTHSKPISLNVTPPNGAVPFCDKGLISGRVVFGRVGPFSPGLDMKPQYVDLFWNGMPKGSWKIEGIVCDGTGEIEGVLLHLWVASV